MAAAVVIGLTGLIGSGKSTVAAIFAELGARIIDTDVIAHQLTAPGGAAIASIAQQLGAASIAADGAMNRQLVRELVFAAPQLRAALEQILHPLILEQVKQQLAQPAHAVYTLIAVPLLFRSPSYLSLTQRNIYVDCNYAALMQRLSARSGLAPAQIDAILAQQVARELQLARADDILDNNHDVATLRQQVVRLHNTYLLLR